LAGGEGASARPDNVLFGHFCGGALERAPSSPPAVPSDAALTETVELVPSPQKKAKKRRAEGEIKRKIPDDAELFSAVLDFITMTDVWEEMPLKDVRQKLEQQLNLNEGFQFCFSHTSFFACCV